MLEAEADEGFLHTTVSVSLGSAHGDDLSMHYLIGDVVLLHLVSLQVLQRAPWLSVSDTY